MNNVLVIGTGTIGEPLIGLLSDFKKKLGINVYFHKRTPLVDEIAKVNSLIKRGAKLVVDSEKVTEFKKLGHEAVLVYPDALELCNVIIDCTPAGNLAKKEQYLPLLKKMKDKVMQLFNKFITWIQEKFEQAKEWIGDSFKRLVDYMDYEPLVSHNNNIMW